MNNNHTVGESIFGNCEKYSSQSGLCGIMTKLGSLKAWNGIPRILAASCKFLLYHFQATMSLTTILFHYF